jgi:endonuclease/exonuclease/phosphatase family metal-dependent hydrolase
MRSCTVASFNIHWGRRLRSNTAFDLVETCRQLDADVLALQEVWRPDGHTSLGHEVATALGYELYETWTCRTVVEPKCRVVGGPGDPVGDGHCGIALLTRIPRGPVTEHHLGGFVSDHAERKVVKAEIELEGGSLVVCTSHFPHFEHFSPMLRWRLRGVLPDPHQPAVLMGDFNMWRWVSRFVVPGWHDTVRGATWPAPKPLFQIDHLLATPPVLATDAEVIQAGGSDHLPIRARVSIRG